MAANRRQGRPGLPQEYQDFHYDTAADHYYRQVDCQQRLPVQLWLNNGPVSPLRAAQANSAMAAVAQTPAQAAAFSAAEYLQLINQAAHANGLVEPRAGALYIIICSSASSL